MNTTYLIDNSLFADYPVCSMSDAVAYLREQKVIALDIETGRKFPKGTYDERQYKAGLDPYLSRIIMIQVGTAERRFVIDARYVDYKPLKEILESKTILKVGHNLKFEGKHFLHNLGCRICNIWDTMIVEQLLYNGERLSYSLESLMKRHLGYHGVEEDDLFTLADRYEENENDDWLEIAQKVEEDKLIDKSIRLGFIDIGDAPFTIKQIEYGVTDIEAPLKLYEIQQQGRFITEEDYYPSVGIRLENATTQVLAEIEYKGMDVNGVNWMELYEVNKKLLLERQSLLDNYCIANHKDFVSAVDLFTEKSFCSIQWTSSKQVLKLFKKLGIAAKEKSKQTGRFEWTVGAVGLLKKLSIEYKKKFREGEMPTEIVTNEDLILAFLLFNKAQQSCTTFGKDWLKYVHPITKKIHTSFRQLMISTRLSSTNPNLQQIPNVEGFRSCFTSPKGYKNINTDYASQEVRILADVTKVEDMVNFFLKEHPIHGKDWHSMTASNTFSIVYNQPGLICNKKTHPKERDRAKVIVFRLAFGGGAKSMSEDLGVTDDESEVIVNAFFKGLPGLEEDFEETKRLAVKRGWIEIDSFTGRRYFYPDFNKMEELRIKAFSYYPKDYRKFTKAEKEAFKVTLYENHPEVKLLWKEWGALKGKLERRSLNLREQKCAILP